MRYSLCELPYDHLPLATVVEFGLNCGLDHLKHDIKRLTPPDSNVFQGFVAHLFRMSAARGRLSARDWSPDSARLHPSNVIQQLRDGTTVEVYFGVIDPTGTNPSGLLRITAGEVVTLTPAGLPSDAATLPKNQVANVGEGDRG